MLHFSCKERTCTTIKGHFVALRPWDFCIEADAQECLIKFYGFDFAGSRNLLSSCILVRTMSLFGRLL